METARQAIDFLINRVLWTTPTFVAMLAAGVVLTIWSRFVQWRALTHGARVVRGAYDDRQDPGAISHFQALSAALSGTVGLGNIGGVALAIAVGGPGALFWMWVTGFLGMAIKATEVTLAMMYRDTSDPENPHGGAMYVARRGIGEHFGGGAKPVASVVAGIFCATLLISTLTGGNMFQAWNTADITYRYFKVPPLATGAILATMTAAVILGGIKRIGDVAGRLVPVMCGLYLAAGLVVLVVRAADVPGLLLSVVRHAFTPAEAGGAFLGASTWFALTTGLRRALFSNEAGQGTSPIAHCAAKTKEPVREGVVAGLEPFVDTCVVCTLTALVILSTGTWNRAPIGEFGAPIAVDRAGDRATDVGLLPREPGAEWADGDSFFLVVELGPTRRDEPLRLGRLNGVVRGGAAGAGGRRIDWGEMPEGAVAVRPGVHRDYFGAALTGLAFDRAVPGLGKWLVTLACWLFAFSTLISWSYYGEQAVVYLFGERLIVPYKIAFCLATAAITKRGLISDTNGLANLSDLGTGCMLFANLPIVLLLAARAMRAMRDYFRRLDAGELEPGPTRAGGAIAGNGAD